MRTTAATWVKFGAELCELDAVYSLAGSMAISQVEAAGYIALAVAFAIAAGDDDGQIDHLTDKAIERACYWTGERGALVTAFIENGVLSGRRDSDTKPLSIEPGLWETLGGESIRKRKQSRERMQRKRDRDKLNNS